ncbi:TIGR02269 family lipoprotein [Archangium violaceum]|uniref:SitA6 family polymorphic toxin lipoprotein n=1 Tax=Archangium violaceum TaxID=83451 RepID=UPI00193BCAD2|nr:TIGR02269 family lipoprotein [Archangium violaceum]QRK10860.1 TIGR02269 family lipoprotein [Archangium violaceum]
MKTWKLWGLLLGVVLSGCAASGPSQREEGTPDAACMEREETGSCLTLLCDEDACGFFRCEDMSAAVAASEDADEAEGESGSVVLARTGTVGIRLPSPVTPMRYRGWPLRLPGDREPIFVIPWKNHHLRNLLPSQKQLLQEAELRMRRPHEKHHLFPQEFRAWFARNGIDIHQWTMFIETGLHRSIHRGPRGGAWNAAWRQFTQEKEGKRVTKEEIWKYAGELCVRFGLMAPLQPYYGRTRQPPPIGF